MKRIAAYLEENGNHNNIISEKAALKQASLKLDAKYLVFKSADIPINIQEAFSRLNCGIKYNFNGLGLAMCGTTYKKNKK